MWISFDFLTHVNHPTHRSQKEDAVYRKFLSVGHSYDRIIWFVTCWFMICLHTWQVTQVGLICFYCCIKSLNFRNERPERPKMFLKLTGMSRYHSDSCIECASQLQFKNTYYLQVRMRLRQYSSVLLRFSWEWSTCLTTFVFFQPRKCASNFPVVLVAKKCYWNRYISHSTWAIINKILEPLYSGEFLGRTSRRSYHRPLYNDLFFFMTERLVYFVWNLHVPLSMTSWSWWSRW